MLLALLAVVAGCGGGSDGGSAPSTLPACAKPKTTIAKPKLVPRDLPVPPGTVFTASETPFSGQAVVSGISPGDLDSTRSFYKDRLDDAGYRQGLGESEPGETEALFTGRGVRGGWRANTIPECDGAVRLTLVVVKNP